MYIINVKKSAQKELSAIPVNFQTKIIDAIDGLATNPRPDGVKKLKLSKSLWRIRVGDYRIIYSIEDEILILEIQKIGHRKDVYRP
jgi:mRNA interferase RelE/StbE